MEQQPSQAATDLMFVGLDHGVDSVRASGGPLVPFAIVQHGGERALTRFVADRLEEGVDRAVAVIRSEELRGDDVAVLVYDGYLTMPEGRFDAIFAEVVGADRIVTVIAQRYRPKKLLRKFETLGNPVLMPGMRGKL